MHRLVAGRFEIEELAGTGGMGAVYRARDRETGDRIALKTLHAPLAGDHDRFLREAQILERLVHPAIVRHVAHGLFEGAPFLAMEWLEGEDLAARLERGPLGLRDSLTIAGRIADALARAHANGVLHRDIKPSNVFLPDGAPERAKVLDFGVARVLRPLTRVAGGPGTQTGALIGTVGYMAPEQARGERAIDGRVDVFALGCVLFECLSGRPAFMGASAVAILAKILLEDPPPLRSLCDVPAALDELVRGMLSKDPSDRPADAGAVAARLAAVEAVDGPSERAASQLSVTSQEQRYVCVVLATGSGAPAASGDESTLSVADDEAVRQRLGSAASAFGATVEKLSDGSIVATFGDASAATDLAARAARCALALRAVLDGVRAAVGTGRAVVGRALPIGDALDRAAAVLATTAPGQIGLDEVTRSLLDARFVVLEGGAGHQLVREQQEPLAARMLLGKAVPCVGRDRELAALEHAVSHAIGEESAATVLIVGQPGIGKSRLLFELLRGVRERQPPIETWRAGADALSAGSSFALLAELARRVSGVRVGDPAVAAQAKLAARVGRRVPPALAPSVVAFFAELAGAPFGPDHTPELRAARADSKAMERAIARTWETFLEAESAAGLLIVLEDLHWADAQSMRVLLAAIRRLDERPIALVATARPEVHELFPELARSGAQEIRLGELSRKASGKLVRAALGDAVDDAVVDDLCARAAGNAFFLEELIRAAASGRRETLPETVLAMLDARLARLPPEARRVLRAASVFGERFWPRGVATVLGRAPTESSLDVELALLESEELISRQSEGRFASEDELGFRHALVRDAAYATWTLADQRTAHRLAGDWLERLGEPDPKILAEHFERGVDDEPSALRAAASWLRAGRAASTRGANSEAIANHRRGLALVDPLPKNDVRRRIELPLLISLASAFSSMKGFGASEVEAPLAAAGVISQELGEEPQLASLVGLYAMHLFRGSIAEARAFAARALEVAERTGDAALIVEGLRPVTSAACFSGELSLARRSGERAMALYERAVFRGRPIGFAMDPGLNVLNYLAHSLLALGLIEAAEARIEEGRTLARELEHPYGLAQTLYFSGLARGDLRDFEGARAEAERGRDLSDLHEFGFFSAMNRGIHGWALCHLGRCREGIAEMRDCLERLRRQGQTSDELGWRGCGAPACRLGLADGLLVAGDFDAGLAAAVEGLRLIESNPERMSEAPLWRVTGELHREKGDLVRAESAMRRAIETARAQEARLYELKATMSLSRLLGSRGERGEARDLLAPILGWFPVGLDCADLVDARALLVELGG